MILKQEVRVCGLNSSSAGLTTQLTYKPATSCAAIGSPVPVRLRKESSLGVATIDHHKS